MFSHAALRNKETNIKNVGNSISFAFVLILFKLPCQRLQNGEKPKNRLFSNASGRHISSVCSEACLNVNPLALLLVVATAKRNFKGKDFLWRLRHIFWMWLNIPPLTRLITPKHVWNVGVDVRIRKGNDFSRYIVVKKEKKAIRLVW